MFPRFNVQTLKHYVSWVLLAMVVIALITTIVLFNKRIDGIVQDSKDIVELTTQREQFYIEWQNRIVQQNQSDHIKSLYFDYGSELIRQTYQKFRVSPQRQMTPAQIYDLLDTIYAYASSDVFPTASYPDGLFLPLAFAYVETQFVPGAIGGDGERSIYQFMIATAKETYADNGRAYVDGFWLSQKEATWLWFNYYRKISTIFSNSDKEKEVRWSAYAYNRGFYRNLLVPYYQDGLTIEAHLRDFPIRKGDPNYNVAVHNKFSEFKAGFNVFN